jgi:tetratricopeptide (TPR) repeat protein
MALNTDSVAATIGGISSSRLGETDKRVLHFAASIGMEFDWSVLITAMEMEEEPLAESLERLVHHGILKELNWGDTYAFVQVVTLAEAYREISSSRQRVIHKKIAEAYEKLYPDPAPDIIPEMGRQFYLGRVHDKSLLYNRYAAMLAISAFSPDVAIRHLERAREDLSALPGDHRLEEADVLKEIGELYDAIGDDAKADDFYGESLKKLPEEEVTLRALILLSRAEAAHEMSKLGLLHQYCEEAIGLLKRVEHKRGLAMAHFILGRGGYTEGNFEAARKETEAALQLFDPEKDAREVARCYTNLGNVWASINDPAEQARALDSYRKAIKILESLHDYRQLAKAHNNLAISLEDTRPEEALKEIKAARVCVEKCKDERFLGWTLFNSVEIHLILGNETEAAKCNAAAHKILSKFNDLIGLQQVMLNEGMLAQQRKAYEESEKAYMDSLKRAEFLDYPIDVVEVLLHMGIMYADWGKKDEALKTVARIVEIGEDKFSPTKRPLFENLRKRLGIKGTGPT